MNSGKVFLRGAGQFRPIGVKTRSMTPTIPAFYDIGFKTNEEGDPVLLFIGTRKEDRTIKGERFARVQVCDRDGVLIKDHWDNKGKT